GKPRSADGSSIDEIINTAMRLSSCFAAPQDSAHLLTMDEESRTEDIKWIKDIRLAVARTAPQLKHSFRQKLQLIEHGRAPIYDFLGANYVANFGTLNPKRVSHALARSRIKLWTLGLARDDERLFQISRDRYELILCKPVIAINSPIQYSARDIEEA